MVCTSGWWTCGGLVNGWTSSRPPTRSTSGPSVNTGMCNSPVVPLTTMPSADRSALKFQTPLPATPDSNVKQAVTTSSAA